MIDLPPFLSLLVVIVPLISLLTLLVVINIGRPLFFLQQRPGLNGKPFTLIKFRTMRNAVDENGDVLPDAERLTNFGKFLRSSSLDELPTLWNVLKGDMSLVGPRPLLTEYMPLYNEGQLRRHEVRPGITGWAQINGRNTVPWEEKFKLDVWYVDNHSFWLDIKILLLTIKKVFVREGISADNHVTMERFSGND